MLCASVLGLVFAQAVSGRAETVILDRGSPGRTFEGIGALSAGASSRLLLDYPQPQQNHMLDLLFKPGFGASLHHLKVEIGGDVNSTDGTEPSFARTREEFEHPRPEYFQRGYEWWLMREAKRRNPESISTFSSGARPTGLATGIFPTSAIPTGGSGGPDDWNFEKFYTQDNADFIVRFIQAAKAYHGVNVHFCGIWNETLYDVSWIKLLRRTLDRRGFSGWNRRRRRNLSLDHRQCPNGTPN